MSEEKGGVDLLMADIGQALLDSFKKGAEWAKSAKKDDRIFTDHMGTYSAARECSDQIMSRLIREAYYRRQNK